MQQLREFLNENLLRIIVNTSSVDFDFLSGKIAVCGEFTVRHSPCGHEVAFEAWHRKGDLSQLWPLLGNKGLFTETTLEWFRLHFDTGAVVECKNDFRSPTLVEFYGFAKVQISNAQCYDSYPSNYIGYRDRISEAGDGSYSEMARFLLQMQPGLREMLSTSVPFAKLLEILDAPVRIPEQEWTAATTRQQIDIAADEVMKRIRANFDSDQEQLLAPLVEKARVALRKCARM